MRHSASRKRHGRRKASAGNRRRLLLLPALLLSLVLGLPTTALAYWTTTGSGQRTAPTATLAPPASVTATSTTGSNSATITWSASPSGAPTGYRVERSANGGGSWTTACAQASYPTAGSCTDSALANGTYQYRVVALKGSWTAPLAATNPITITRDTVAPTVTVARASGQVTPTRTQPMSFTATFSETVTGLTAAGVQVSSGTGVQGTAVVGVTGSGTTWTITVGGLSSTTTALSGGTVTVSLLANAAQDVGGNGSLASTGSTNVVTLDTTGPVAPIAPVLTTASDSGVSSTDRITNAANLVFSSTASGTGTGTVPADAANVRLYHDSTASGAGTLVNATPATVSNGNFSITHTAPTEGVHYYSLVYADALGNLSAQGPRLMVTVDRTAPAAPTVTGATQRLTGLLSADVTASGAYSNGTNDAGSVRVYACTGAAANCTVGTALANGSTTTLTGGVYSATASVGGLLPGVLGQFTVIVTQTDIAGNVSAPSAPRQATTVP